MTNQSDCLFTAARADAAEGLSALAGVSAFVGREQSSWILLYYLWLFRSIQALIFDETPKSSPIFCRIYIQYLFHTFHHD